MHSRPPAIELIDVCKRYRLYRSRLAMLAELLGAGRLLPSSAVAEREALRSVSITAPSGSRIGIIGRNGSGKTTLLKLITRNFAPTSGTVRVSGKIQALMTTGLGFHPELTGLQNIRASLIYNGLAPKEMEQAYEDIIDFVELGDYLDQPIKNYSLGMQARLGFATATAIRPDILIIDEVLGAGDAYFAAKSTERLQELTATGLTLLLVSHSMPQVIQFCERTIWLDEGRVVMDGESLEVVKAYERFIRELDDARLREKNRGAATRGRRIGAVESSIRAVSTWPGVRGLKIREFSIEDASGAERAVFDTGDELTYRVRVESEDGLAHSCVVAINTYLLDGRQVMLDWSEPLSIGSAGATVRLRYRPLLLGNGEYVVSVALYKTLDMQDTTSAVYYDLWDRSFQFKVVNDFPQDHSVCKAPSEWLVSTRETAQPSRR